MSPISFQKDPTTGRFKVVGQITAEDKKNWENQPPPKPVPEAPRQSPASRFLQGMAKGVNNELLYRSRQVARFNDGQKLISGSAGNPLMGGDPLYVDARKPKSVQSYSPTLRSTAQIVSGGLVQAPTNAALALVNLSQRLISGEPLKPQVPEKSPVGKAIVGLQNLATRGLFATPPSKLRPEDKGFLSDLPASIATNAALAFVPGTSVGPAAFSGVAAKAPFLSPGAQSVLARGLRWGTNAAANEALSGLLDDSTQGQAGDLLKAVGAPVPNEFLTNTGDDRISAGVKGIIPGIVFGEALGFGAAGVTKAIGATINAFPNAARNLKEHRLATEARTARQSTVANGLQTQDPETGEYKLNRPEPAAASPAASPAAPAPRQNLADLMAGKLDEYAQKTGQVQSAPAPAAAAAAPAAPGLELEQNQQIREIPSQQMEPGGAVQGEFQSTTSEPIDQWFDEYDPSLPEIDAPAMALDRLDDQQISEVYQQATAGPVLPAIEQVLATQRLPEPDPALRVDRAAIPTDSVADPVVGVREQWESLPTERLQSVASPDNSPELFERIQSITGRDWEQFTRRDMLDGLDKLREDGQTVIADRLLGQEGLLPVDEIQADPLRFQFKQGIDEQGQQLGNSLAGVEKWNTDMEGVLQVWEDPIDGNTYVVNGHNRLAKAKELGVPTLRTKALLSPTAEQARAQGAISNIADGKGTAIDAAKFLRDSGVTDEARLSSMGIPLNSGFGAQGLALSRLPGNIFQDTIDGSVTLNKAVALGQSGLDETGMQQAYKALQNTDMSEATWSEVLQQAGSAPVVQGTQIDLFGNVESMNLMVQKGQLAAAVKGDLISDKNLMKKVGSNADKLNQVGNNQIDITGTQQVASEAEMLLAQFNAGKYAAGNPISQLLNEGAEQIAAGGKLKTIARRIKGQLAETLATAKSVAPTVFPDAGQIAVDAVPTTAVEAAPTVLSPADMRQQILQRAIENGEVRASSSPLIPQPDAPKVDVVAAARDLQYQLDTTGTIAPDSPAAQLLEDEARLAATYSERDTAIAIETARASREANNYWDLTLEEKLAHNNDAAASGPGLNRDDVNSLEQQAVFARQQERAARDAGNESAAKAWNDEWRRTERARIAQEQSKLDASQQSMFEAGQFDTTTPLLNGEELANQRPAVPSTAVKPIAEFDAAGQAQVVAKLNRQLGIDGMGFSRDGSNIYARGVVEAKGVVDLPAAMGAKAAAKAEAQFKSGTVGPESETARQILREFYGVKPDEKALIADLGDGNDVLDAISGQLKSIAQRVAGDDAVIKLTNHYERLTLKPEWGGDGVLQSKQAGSYHLMNDVITINGALTGNPRELIATTFHESFHRLQYGLLTEVEMKVMDSAFSLQRITNYSRLSPDKVSNIERMAVAFENYATAREFGGDIAKEEMLKQLADSLGPKWANAVTEVAAAFEKVLAFIEQVKNYATGNGFTSIDDIFDRAYSGEIAKSRAFNSAAEMLEPNQAKRYKVLERWRKDAAAPAADIGAAIATIDSQIEALKTKAISGGC